MAGNSEVHYVDIIFQFPQFCRQKGEYYRKTLRPLPSLHIPHRKPLKNQLIPTQHFRNLVRLSL